jgi:hypothetical protein
MLWLVFASVVVTWAKLILRRCNNRNDVLIRVEPVVGAKIEQ